MTNVLLISVNFFRGERDGYDARYTKHWSSPVRSVMFDIIWDAVQLAEWQHGEWHDAISSPSQKE